MKKEKILKYSLIAITLAACILGACQSVNKFFGVENDHVIEEALEELIEDVTGLEDLDLTPEELDYSDGCWFCD